MEIGLPLLIAYCASRVIIAWSSHSHYSRSIICNIREARWRHRSISYHDVCAKPCLIYHEHFRNPGTDVGPEKQPRIWSDPNVGFAHLVLVAVGRCQISQVLLLLIGNGVRVDGDTITLAVLKPYGCHVDTASCDRQTAEGHADAVAWLIEGRVFREERVGSDDATDIAEAHLPGSAHATPVMAAQVHGEPTYDDRHGAVSTACDEEERTVLGRPVCLAMNGEEHSEASNCNSKRDQGESKPVLEAIGAECNQH